MPHGIKHRFDLVHCKGFAIDGINDMMDEGSISRVWFLALGSHHLAHQKLQESQ